MERSRTHPPSADAPLSGSRFRSTGRVDDDEARAPKQGAWATGGRPADQEGKAGHAPTAIARSRPFLLLVAAIALLAVLAVVAAVLGAGSVPRR